MQIKKIDNNKLKVILNLNDLDKKNIDIDSFLSNSIESKDLFFEILNLAEEEYDFDIENNKAVVEAISLDNSIFILTITKLKSDIANTYNHSNIYCFETIDDVLNLFSYIHKNNINLTNTQLFNYLDKYYLLINNIDPSLKNILLEYSSFIKKR